MFLYFSLFFCFLSYFNIDPLKSRFFLIISLLLLSPYTSNRVRQLFCYFICLLFLSGIFVIIVYFSSLSNIILKKTRFLIFGLLISFLFLNFLFLNNSSFFIIYIVYRKFFFVFLVYLIFCLLFFLNISSFFLITGGSLRKF